jgi:hypothetical protein
MLLSTFHGAAGSSLLEHPRAVCGICVYVAVHATSQVGKVHMPCRLMKYKLANQLLHCVGDAREVTGMFW